MSMVTLEVNMDRLCVRQSREMRKDGAKSDNLSAGTYTPDVYDPCQSRFPRKTSRHIAKAL
jgi:hypothetical protein